MTLQQITANDIAGWDSLQDIADSFEKRGLKPRPNLGKTTNWFSNLLTTNSLCSSTQDLVNLRLTSSQITDRSTPTSSPRTTSRSSHSSRECGPGKASSTVESSIKNLIH